MTFDNGSFRIDAATQTGVAAAVSGKAVLLNLIYTLGKGGTARCPSTAPGSP